MVAPAVHPSSPFPDSAFADIFSPTRVSPSFSRFNLDLASPLLFAPDHTRNSELKPADTSELRMHAVSSIGFTSALCSQNLIPRHSPLLSHRSSFSSSSSTSPSSGRKPLRLFISSRYQRTSHTKAKQYADADTKHPKALPSFQVTPSDNSDSEFSSDEDDSDSCDETPTLSPSKYDKTPLATPAVLTPSSAEEHAINGLLMMSLGK